MTELTTDQALQKGVEAHNAGQVQEADRFYTAILNAQPKHPDANHNMGVLAVGVGNVQKALPFFKTALEANPATAQFWLSYIDALIKLDKFADAMAVLNQAKSNGAKGDSFNKLEQRLNDAKLIRPNILYSLKLNQAVKLANAKVKEGSLEEARNIYQDILTKFPKNKRARDGLKMLAGGSAGEISKVQDPPEDQLQSLIDLYSQGQLQQALKQAEALVQKFPLSLVLYNIKGAVLQGLGQLDLSIEAYNKALEIEPNYADAYYNMGMALQRQGKLKEAIEAYNKALAIKPDYADAYNNMGVVLQDQGKKEEAIEAYTRALSINPNYAEAYNNMGNSLKGIVFQKSNPDLQKIISLLLDQRTRVRSNDIAFAAISLLRLEPKLQRHLEAVTIDKTRQALQQTVSELSELPLLLKLMSLGPLADLGLENLLKKIRTRILLALPSLECTSDLLKFQSALALQCFTNEYIYNQSKDEEKAIEALEDSIEASLSKGEKPRPQAILCLASYKALNEYKWCDLLSDSSDIHQVFTRQVSEPRQEIQLKSNMPMLEEITDDVSVKVQAQYEENPYPRWVNSGLPLNPEPISKVVAQAKIKLFDNKICEVSTPDIMVAGCGTGQHSIDTAAEFKNAKVLAIDLSLSSLAYAKRKTEELGVTNIEYMQADILKLKKLDKQFHIIESTGVLHHMDNPMAGWKVLVDCLRDGGLMKIGLYSEIARQKHAAIRAEIYKLGIKHTEKGMKSFRKDVISSNIKHHMEIKLRQDFYSLSNFRDLLFNVQEHRFTISQLKQSLEELGLKFCGFENDSIVQKFKVSNTGSNDPYDLDKWQGYEEANPRTFASMYQFWCQKIG